MDTTGGITFKEFQEEERFKKLKRDLKVGELEKKNKSHHHSTLLSWPNLSSIHPEGLDSSSSVDRRSLDALKFQNSRIGSEVIASSINLRKVLLNINSSRPTATSSVKKFNMNGGDQDRAMMPPPFRTQSYLKIIPKTIQGHSENYDSSSKVSDSKLNSENLLGCHTFYNWTVKLNKEGRLAVKGTLENGIVVRSKPIAERLNSTELKSIFKHKYLLVGNIVDENKELPEYIRGKFFNGFPDDWQNVYQLWRNYVSQGRSVTFRWPTPITDSDDDLISEVTYFGSKRDKFFHKEDQNDLQKNKDSEENLSLGYHSKNSSSINRILDRSREVCEKNTETPTILDKKIEISSNSIDFKNSCQCNCKTIQDIKNANNFNSSSSLNNTSYFDIIKEDKLRVILSNLSDKNCPQHYLQKFVESIEWLKTIFSYSNNNSETDDRKQNLSNKSQSEVCHNSQSESFHQDSKELVADQHLNDESLVKKSESSQKIQNHVNCKQTENFDEKKTINAKIRAGFEKENDSSDSENYMGIPNVSLNHILKLNTLKTRHKERKNRMNRKNKGTNDQLRGYDHKPHNQVDSSVSITDDEVANDNRASKQNLEKQTVKTKDTLVKIDKQKPVIKSCEKVHYNFNVKYQPKPKYSKDMVKIDSSSCTPSQVPLNKTPSKNEINVEEILTEDPYEHHFLTFESGGSTSEDSDTVQTEGNTSINNKLFDNPKETEVKKIKIRPYGSEENPKILAGWIPCIVYENEFKDKRGLTFKGALLNEAKHVIDKKFSTNCVLKRHSSKLIETVDREFYKLDGELYDPKHTIPKELQKLCRTGCPLKIKEFCLKWKKEKSSLNNDEKISKRGTESTFEEKLVDRVSKMDDLNKIAGNQFQKDHSDSKKDVRLNDMDTRKSKPAQRRLKRNKSFTPIMSSSESDECKPQNKKFLGNSMVKTLSHNLDRQQVNNNVQVARDRLNLDVLTESAYNSKLRRNRGLRYNEKSGKKLASSSRSSRQSEIIWTLDKEKKKSQDVLSEDQDSIFTK